MDTRGYRAVSELLHIMVMTVAGVSVLRLHPLCGCGLLLNAYAGPLPSR